MIPEKIKFVKMHGNGNDFIILDEFNSTLIPESKKPSFVRAISHRYFGLGADGVIFVQKAQNVDADIRFRYFNSDGSEAEMCGNGIRCFSRYVFERGYVKNTFKAETLAGVISLNVSEDEEGYWIRVNMGKAKFSKEDIPTLDDVWGREFKIYGHSYNVYAVNTGVPHAVVFVDNLDIDVERVAKEIRYSRIFPQGVNVNFVKVENRNKALVRTYERGVERETLSCGTGAVAVAVVAEKLGKMDRDVEIITIGGKLRIEIKNNGLVYMAGQASKIAEGEIITKELRYDI